VSPGSCGDLAQFLSERSLHDPVRVLNTEDLVEILVRSSLRGPCMRSLQMHGACMKALVGGSWEVPVSRSCKIRYSCSRSFYDDLVRFS